MATRKYFLRKHPNGDATRTPNLSAHVFKKRQPAPKTDLYICPEKFEPAAKVALELADALQERVSDEPGGKRELAEFLTISPSQLSRCLSAYLTNYETTRRVYRALKMNPPEYFERPKRADAAALKLAVRV